MRKNTTDQDTTRTTITMTESVASPLHEQALSDSTSQLPTARTLLPQEERKRVLELWNATDMIVPEEICIHHLFEAQAQRTPDALAILYEYESMTYSELDRRANQLAHHLQGLGVGPEAKVGIFMERKPEMVVGLLGVLKAGGAYVPLDPAYPKERLAFMLDDAQVQVLLSQQNLLAYLPSCTAPVLFLDATWDTTVEQDEAPPLNGLTSANLAYVIYTSGSTGRPKGVAIEHSSVVAYLHWARSLHSPEELKGMLASTSICFDTSVYELFVSLSWGGTTILAENVLQLATLPAAERVTLVSTVPSAMGELLKLGPLPKSVCTVVLGGEPLHNALAQHLYTHNTVEKVLNLYGPTEMTVDALYMLVEKGADAPPPLGRPIANTRAYVLNEILQPVAIGVQGELYLSGAGIARGYLNHPELTAAAFVDNPFESDPGTRMYKTGDIVHYMPDGRLIYHGRSDDQVKMRGYRIECGEVEAALASHPAVRECAVVAREEPAGERRLMAAVVFHQQPASAVSELRRFLHEHLPAYMVPDMFVFFPELPRLPNGKVNRVELANYASPTAVDAGVLGLSGMHNTVAEAWAHVLHLTPPIDIEASFFELGGHSLLAVSLIAHLREALNAPIPLGLLFEAPTIAQLSAKIVEWQAQNTTSAV